MNAAAEDEKIGELAPSIWPLREGSTELKSFLHDLIRMSGVIEVPAEFPWARGSSSRLVQVHIRNLAVPLLREIMRQAEERRGTIQGYLARLNAADEEMTALSVALEAGSISPEIGARLQAAVMAQVANIPNSAAPKDDPR